MAQAQPAPRLESEAEIERDLLGPLQGTGGRLAIIVGGVLLVLGIIGLVLQLGSAHGALDWGLYIATFNFLFGLSAGSFAFVAILRLTHADYRRSLTRAFEAMGVFALIGLFLWIPIAFQLPAHGQLSFFAFWPSNVPWITMALITWFVIILAVLWNGVMPDAAVLRDRYAAQGGFRYGLYRRLALGWRGTLREWHYHDFLRTGLAAATLLFAPVAQAVIGWELGMTFAPESASSVWIIHNAQNYFFGTLAFGVLLLGLLRNRFGLQRYIRESTFEVFGQFLLALTVIWFYLFFAQLNVMWYGAIPHETYYLHQRTIGPFAPYFWTAIVWCVTVVPFFTLIFRPVRRSLTAVSVISAFIVVGSFLWIFLNVAPFLNSPEPDRGIGTLPPLLYALSLPQLLLALGAIGAQILFYGLFVALFPIVSLWDQRHERALSTRLRLYGVDLPAIGKPEEVGTWSPVVNYSGQQRGSGGGH